MSTAEAPGGFRYEAGFVAGADEDALVAFARSLSYEPVVMHGVTARRSVRHFGLRYAFDARTVTPADPIPAELLGLRDRAGQLAGRRPDEFVEALVTRYPPGATIGWHRDAPMFGGVVVGVSLLSACRLRFRRTTAAGSERWACELAPGSAYVLEGAARWSWQHSIPPTTAERYSVTFRTLRSPS